MALLDKAYRKSILVQLLEMDIDDLLSLRLFVLEAVRSWNLTQLF